MVDFETNCITRTQTRTQFEEFAINPNMMKLANQLNANSTIYFHLAILSKVKEVVFGLVVANRLLTS
jgi:hypothetical protein